jgi:hypothetical protein
MARMLPMLALALAACAPGANLRPLEPMGDHAWEAGLGATTISPRPYRDEPWRTAAQGWTTARPTSWFDLSLVGAFDGEHGTAGLSTRFRIAEGDRWAFGTGLLFGSGWIGVELPISVGLTDWLWVYTGPSWQNWGLKPTVRLPLGVDLHLADRLRFRTEAEYNDVDYDPYQRRIHVSFGVAYLP